MAKDLYQRETWKKHHVLQHAENVTNIKKKVMKHLMLEFVENAKNNYS